MSDPQDPFANADADSFAADDVNEALTPSDVPEDQAPLDAGGDDGALQADTPPAIDPAQYAQLQQAYQQEAAARQQAQAQLQNQAYQVAQAAWKQAEAQMLQQASGMDAFDRAEHMQAFYQQREQGLLGAYQQLQQQNQLKDQYLQVQAEAKHLIAQHGLDATDERALLALGAIDPGEMRAYAQQRALSKSEIDSVKQEIEKLKRGQQRGDRIASGAERVGGRGGGGLPANTTAGTDDHLLGLFERAGVPFVPR